MMIKELLEQGLDYQQIELTQEQVQQLMQYIELLSQWNKVYNLTSIKDRQQMVILHLLDSLSILAKIKEIYSKQKINILDVGTGGGLPGIPLSIVLPQAQLTLVDARAKKIRFLQQVCRQLKLTNVIPLHTRIEAFQPDKNIDIIVTRAFSSIKDMLSLCSHLCHTNTHFFAMKAKIEASDELKQIPEPFTVKEIVPLDVYQLDAERHLVIIH